MLLSPLTLVYWALVWNVARLFLQYQLTWIESVIYTVILILCISFYKDITNRLYRNAMSYIRHSHFCLFWPVVMFLAQQQRRAHGEIYYSKPPITPQVTQESVSSAKAQTFACN